VQANSEAAAPPQPALILLIAAVVAAIGALALVQEARQRGEVLDLVEVTGAVTAGGHDRARIEWRQRRSSGDAVVRIIDRDDTPVRTLLDGEPLAGDDRQQVFHWNGRTDSGGRASPGRYRVEILLLDQDREIVPEQGVITVREDG